MIEMGGVEAFRWIVYKEQVEFHDILPIIGKDEIGNKLKSPRGLSIQNIGRKELTWAPR